MPPSAESIAALRTETSENGQPILDALLQHLAEVQQELDTIKRRVFDKSSEKMASMASEVRRTLDDAEVQKLAKDMAEAAEQPEVTPAVVAKARRRVGRKRSEKKRKEKKKSRLANLPVVIEEREVSVNDLPEGMTLADFEKIGEEYVERIVVVKAHLVRVRYILPKLKHKEQSGVIVQASSPPSPVAGGLYGACVFAHLITMRFSAGLPIRRISSFYAQQGMDIAPSTLVTQLHRAAGLLLPVYLLLLEQVRTASHVFADETTQPYQKPGSGKTGKGWMWMALSSSAIVYQFAISRSQAAGRAFLGTLIATLMADGYSGYNGIAVDGFRAACWAHVRRYFFEQKKDWPEAAQILDLITRLYVCEAVALLLPSPETPSQRLRRRQTESKPLVEEVFRIAASMDGRFSPSSSASKALEYMRRRKSELMRFLEDPLLPLDNNISERALRCVALARKVCLFVGPGDNGQSYAILLSIVHTCLLHDVDLNAYLIDVLPRLRLLNEQWKPAGDATPSEVQDENLVRLRPQYERLCPAAWQPGAPD